MGSAFKPIAVYAPALNERIITEASPVLDEQTDFNGYKPSNAGGYSGWTTIKNSVAKSLNVPAVKTLNALGLDKAQRYLEKLGIQGEQNLSMALGNVNGGVDLFTLAKGYSTLANDGVCNDVCFIKKHLQRKRHDLQQADGKRESFSTERELSYDGYACQYRTKRNSEKTET